MKRLLPFVVLASILAACGDGGEQPFPTSSNGAEFELFTELTAAESGIDFYHGITESDSLNVYDYANTYSGGGVAIADFDGDGLPDIFLTGNQVADRLFRNTGNLQFEDITETSGIEWDGGWSSGVTVADVNADGLTDIYITRAFYPNNPALRSNLLYINQGEGRFKEAAKQYGLDDQGFGTQSLFFDYDLDGDLDLFVGNFPWNFEQDTRTRMEYRKNPYPEGSCKLYVNFGKNGFRDMTEQAGLLTYCWTLGLAAGDLSGNGYPDLYICADHDEPDYLFINNGDGTFSDETMRGIRHMSQFSMGVDIADINNDALPDIYQADMLAMDNYRNKTQMSGMNPEKFWGLVTGGYHYQYMRNSLQLNNGNRTFSEIGQLAGVHGSDWSWATLMADFDNDGWRDIFVANGYKVNMRDKDWKHDVDQEIDSLLENHGIILTNAQVASRLPLAPKLRNHVFLNNGDYTFEERAASEGFKQLTYSTGAAYGDLDQDGDLDLVVNNLEDTSFVYRNNQQQNDPRNYLKIKLKGAGGNQMGIGARVWIFSGDEQKFAELNPSRGFQSSVDPVLHFGLGEWEVIDSLRVVWSGGHAQSLHRISFNQVLELDRTQASDKYLNKPDPQLFKDYSLKSQVRFMHRENSFNDFEKEVLLPHQTSRYGPALAVADLNGDGLDDFYAGGAKDQPGSIWMQIADGTFKQQEDNDFGKDASREDIGAVFLDADGDGDQDLYVTSGGNEWPDGDEMYQDRLYLNDGNGRFSKAVAALPVIRGSGGRAIAHDIDADGDPDLLVCGRIKPGTYPFPGRSYLLRNEGGRFTDASDEWCPELMEIGMLTDAVFADLDGDGSQEMILAGEWMSPRIFHWNGQGYEEQTTESLSGNVGWWNCLHAFDADGDGDLDLAAGNLGLNYKYQGDSENPFHIFCHDFDENGTLDIVLSQFNTIDDTYMPVRGRQCSSEQMPALKKQFPTYKDFASTDTRGIYQDKLAEALHYAATEFRSGIFFNEGANGFRFEAFPMEAQFSPVMDILQGDMNQDGKTDLLIAGNFHVSEVETGKADAGNGLFMKGDGSGSYQTVPLAKTNFDAPLDVRYMDFLRGPNGRVHVIVANNAMPIQLIEVLYPGKELLP